MKVRRQAMGLKDKMEEQRIWEMEESCLKKPPTSDLIHTYNSTTQKNVLALREKDKPNSDPCHIQRASNFFLFWPNSSKTLHVALGKCSSMINILKLFPKFFLLIFFTSSHIFPLLFIFPLLYVLITLKPRDNSKKLKTLLRSQLSLLLSITLLLIPNCLLFLTKPILFCFCACANTTSCPIKPYSSWSKFESSKLLEI